MTIAHRAEYAPFEVAPTLPGAFMYDVTDPRWEPVGTAFFRAEGEHCFHMTFWEAGYRWEPRDEYDSHGCLLIESVPHRYIYRVARFIDTCCRPDCGEEIIR